jgi:hypothetical protein
MLQNGAAKILPLFQFPLWSQQYNLHPETQYSPLPQPSWANAIWPLGQFSVMQNGAIENGALVRRKGIL